MSYYIFDSKRYMRVLTAAAAVVTFSSICVAQDAPIAQTFGSRGPLHVEVDQANIELPSSAAKLRLRNQPQVSLGPVDVESLLAEDEEAAVFRKVFRVGVLRDTMVRAEQGQWHETEKGRIWSTDIVADGSNGTRLHIIGMHIPNGASLYVYNPDNPLNVDGPLKAGGRFDNGEMWTRTIWNQRVRVEYFVPNDVVKGHGDDVPFVISELSHWYRPLAGDDNGRGGPCHNDVTCFPAWQNVADATGLLSFIDGGAFVCTGELLDTEASDLTPYLYTANHCIGNNTVAQTAEVFWFFQSNICDGAPSVGPSNVDITFIDGNSTLDYSLLMIHDQLPGGLFWVGWTTSVPPNGQDAVAVHHPAGSHKRISFGIRFNGSVCGPGGSINYHRVSWDLPDGGVVEGGSSGSGIYREDTQQLFGALFCGTTPDPCANPAADDDYGRFDRFYVQAAPDISDLLEAGSDDSFEENDTCATAAPIAPGTYNEPMIVKSTAEDWYAITLNQGDQLTVTAAFDDTNGDIDMELHDVCGARAVVKSSTSNTDNETFIQVQGPGSTTYFLRVFIDETDTRAEYSLTIDIDLANDACGSGVQANAGSTPFTTIGATTDGPADSGSCGFPDNNLLETDIWFTFIAPCTDTVTVSICDADFQPRLAAYFVLCPAAPGNPDPIACDEGSCPGGAQMSFAANMGSTYQIRIASKNGIPGSGTLNIVCGVPPCPADIADPDSPDPDGSVDVFDLLELLANWGTAGPGAEIAAPTNVVDVFDLLDLLAAWGGC